MQKLFVRLSVVVLLFSVAVSAQKRNITEKDLFDFAWVADPPSVAGRRNGRFC